MKKLGIALLGTTLIAGKTLAQQIEKVYSVQIGAFSKKENAERKLRSLPEELKKEAFVYINERGFYTVRIGKAKNQRELVHIKRLLRKHKIKGFVSKTIIAKKEEEILKPKVETITVSTDKTYKEIINTKKQEKKEQYKTKKKISRKNIEKSTNQIGYYSIQLGAFSTEYNAQRFIQRLPEKLKGQAFIYKNEKGFYTVRIGKAGNVKELIPLKRLLRKYGFTGFIVKTKGVQITKEPEEVIKETTSIKDKIPSAVSTEKIVSTEKRLKPKKSSLFYSILVAITNNKELAESIASDYEKEFKLKTFVKEKITSFGKKEYYVYLGEFTSEAEAKEFMIKHLKGTYPIEAIEKSLEKETVVEAKPETEIEIAPVEQEINLQPVEKQQKQTQIIEQEIKETPQTSYEVEAKIPTGVIESLETKTEENKIINTGIKPIYSVLVLKTTDKEEAYRKKKEIEEKFPEVKVYIKEKIIGFEKKEYYVYAGEFLSLEESEKFAEQLIGSEAGRPDIVGYSCAEAEIVDGKLVFIDEEAKDTLEPVVENRISPEGTPENRRVEIRVIPFGASEKEIDLSDYINKGLYVLNIWIPKIHYLPEIKDVYLVFKPPKGFSYVLNSALLNGKKVYPKKENGFYIVKIPSIKGSDEIDFKLQFLAQEKISLKNMPIFIVGKDKRDHLVKIYGFDIYKDLEEEVLKLYQKEEKKEEKKVKKEVDYGIIYPEDNQTQTEQTTDIIINVPLKASYKLYVNGNEVSEDKIGEKIKDKDLNLLSVKYISVPLKKGKNEIILKTNNVSYKKTIFVSDDVTKLRVKIFPERPPADGKTPAYITVELLDKDGVPIRNTTFIEAYVDKGDIWDESTGEWLRFGDRPLKVKAYAGKAVLKLSPASSTEERRVKIWYGEIEKEFTVRFYPEKRPWIVVGNIEGGIGFGDTKNNPDQTQMPFKHKDGTRLKGQGAVFAKGSVKDYTVTFRYQTEKPDNVLMNQNIPSTEENQYYPIYGEDSEQYFEARSKNRLFFKVEKDLSYLMFGDYRTNIGSDLEFNRYNRTFNGVDLNIQKEKNYRIQGFITKNSQEQLKEEIPGKGISGPYFLKNSVREYSERIWIETRDRFNPNIILDRRELNRFTDYTINYEEGFIIFHEPIKQFDDNFNPNYIVVIYETDNLQEEKYTYGLRGEKRFLDGKLRFGITGIKEEHVLTDKKLYGADVLYETDKLRLLGEISRTETDNDGYASKIEGRYAVNQYVALRGYYKRVKEGYQNLSAITADYGYETYGANITATTKDGKTRVLAEAVVENRDIDRKTGSLMLDRKVNEKLSLTFGGRIHREKNDAGTDTRGLAIAGLTYRPNKKLSISLRREQAIKDDKASQYYPTRTIGRIDYKVSNWFNTYLQSEYQERADKDVSLTTLGLEGKLRENTTAFSKYTVDDGASGWRTQSHIGLNHLFKINDKISGDISVENVNTFTGDDKGDYTSVSVRGAYLQNKRYKLSAGYEIRFGDFEPNHLLTVGGITKVGKGGTFLVRERYFKNEKHQNDLLIGFAYRPVDTDVWNTLLKFRWKAAKGEIYNHKYLGSLHFNIQPNSKLRTSWQYAFKYTTGGSIGDTFVDVYRGRVAYDITDKVDIGAHGGVLWDHKNKNYSYAYGPEVGYTLYKNFWVSVGYNVQGFHDDDFEEANYWSKGAYVKFRLKFDEDLFKKFLKDN
ncbi:MAG: SPOR domain-containing protein [Aquificae bacterium]|nr:SPOR domain-containing protein [Aquificota bacterium]